MWKKSDVTPFVILNIFISNCNLITPFFLVTVTNYNYFYFVIKLELYYSASVKTVLNYEKCFINGLLDGME